MTVGISRSDEALFTVRLVGHILEAGAARGRLSYVNLRTLAALDLAVAEVKGYTRYRIDSLPDTREMSIVVVDQGGEARGLGRGPSPIPALRGTKKLVVEEREVLVARGRSDGRMVVFVPEVNAGITTGLTLLHVDLHERLDVGRTRRVLDGYRRRLTTLTNAVRETESSFDEARLALLPLDVLLTEPVSILADQWRRLDEPDTLRAGESTAEGGHLRT